MTLRDSPPDPLRERVEKLVGPVTAWHPVRHGYTAASRHVAELADGGAVFVKAATTALTTRWLRAEHAMLAARPATFMPVVAGWDDADCPVLVLEYLAGAQWPPPWDDERVARAIDVLTRIHAHPAPAGLPLLTDRCDQFPGWEAVAADPTAFLGLGLVDEAWLAAALPTMRAAAAAARLDGDALLHGDFRSDNVAFLADRVVVVDWDRCMVGNPEFDVAFWAPSLRHEGGPPPEAVADVTPEMTAFVAGFFAERAGLPPPRPRSTVRALQAAQLRVVLPWACRQLALPEPPAIAAS